MVEKVSDVFREKFYTEPLVVRSPGRVNIIGEHVDYNEGFVLPAAINKAMYVAVGKRDDAQIHLYSCTFNESFVIALDEIRPTGNWATYIIGVVSQLINEGYKPSGFNAVLDGDIPIGAGLSSSAALECAAIFALNELFSFHIGKMKMVMMAQKAEHTYAGVMCGIMDQFASMFGKKGHVIKLDCRSLEYEYKPLKLEGYKIILFDTNIKHSLASSEYNTRRQQCEQGVEWIKKVYPSINSLRDVTLQMLDKFVAPKDAIVYKRCKYVVEEIERLQHACDDLDVGDIASLGKKMFSTHDGLSRDYEVSCPELDYLIDKVKGNPGILGARMMGGGFGGCTINLVKEDAIDEIANKISIGYKRDMGLDLLIYTAKIGQGTEIVTRHAHAYVE